MKKETITITKNQFFALRRDSEEYRRLEEAGVDNWDGWHDVQQGTYGESFNDIHDRLMKEIFGKEK